VSRYENLPKESYGEPYRATSRTFDTKPSKPSKSLFELIHDKEPQDDASDKKVA
jgi:hypothetical protein